MFEDALALEDLKTASGVLIILQGIEDEAELEGEKKQQKDGEGIQKVDGEEEDENEDESDLDEGEDTEDEADATASKSLTSNRRTELHTHIIRLMSIAFSTGDYDLCAELARFVMGIDPTARVLKRVVAAVPGLGEGMSASAAASPVVSSGSLSRDAGDLRTTSQVGRSGVGLGLTVPKRGDTRIRGGSGERSPAQDGNGDDRRESLAKGKSPIVGGDYFSDSPGGY
ncbi:uncharacterized protein AB675_6450 [Cyphellophora attinorum]|uniref:RIC1 C-terminal alpha solenoid region domain-containing protein n=1 Tax=Cyphellophora attinorum TaxID=1664694 RepID=A0A0N1P2R0_9EURO|nr:uncharacterized protein AB675_6450 [Phialophora attinorum]KPI43923.1 hypothetical protein AB675_6450 [Phialophora attinorum]